MPAHSVQTKDANTRQVIVPASPLCTVALTADLTQCCTVEGLGSCRKYIGLSLRTCCVYSGNQAF
jgi:hypothetical protein